MQGVYLPISMIKSTNVKVLLQLSIPDHPCPVHDTNHFHCQCRGHFIFTKTTMSKMLSSSFLTRCDMKDFLTWCQENHNTFHTSSMYLNNLIFRAIRE